MTPPRSGILRVTVTSEGKQISDEYSVISVSVKREIGKIPTASLTLIDGDMPKGEFNAGNSKDFIPGREIEIRAGYGVAKTIIFKGLVIRHSLSISRSNSVNLSVECKDKAVKMTKCRKQVRHQGDTDKVILSKLIKNHGLEPDVSNTVKSCNPTSQNDATDWDYLLIRAEANGLQVMVTDGKVQLAPVKKKGSPVMTVRYGYNLYSFSAKLDAAAQLKSVITHAWDPSEQKMIKAQSDNVDIISQGNLDSKQLSKILGDETLELWSTSPMSQADLKNWANARLLRPQLALIQGSMSFAGDIRAVPGAYIRLEKVGDRFNGNVYVTGVTHKFSDGTWTTDVQFGRPDKSFAQTPNLSSPPANGKAPPIRGLHIGVVTQLEKDPDKASRVQVKIPTLGDQPTHPWARLANFHASEGFGAFFIPEIGDEVLLGFLNNDSDYPVILGSLYSGKRQPPVPLDKENNIKTILTREKMELTFDEKNKTILLKTPGNNQLSLSDSDKAVIIKDQNGNTVELSSSGISLDSPKDISISGKNISISAKAGIKLDAKQAVDISAKTDATIKGLNVTAQAQVGATVKGNATAELSAAGQTTVKGVMVMIN